MAWLREQFEEYNVVYVDDATMAANMREWKPEDFDVWQRQKGARRVDLWRYERLTRGGGAYIDVESMPTTSCREIRNRFIIQEGVHFVSVIGATRNHIHHWLFVKISRHSSLAGATHVWVPGIGFWDNRR